MTEREQVASKEQVTSIMHAIPEQGQAYTDSIDEITALIRGRVPIIWVMTHEEARFMEEFRARVGKDLKQTLWQWSAYEGLKEINKKKTSLRADGDQKETWNPIKALERIVEMEEPKSSGSEGTCYILRDFHIVLGEQVVRQMRDIYSLLQVHGKTLVIVSPVLGHGVGGKSAGLPPTLEKQVSVVNYELPSYEVIYARIKEVLDHLKGTSRTNEDENSPPIVTKLDYTEEEIVSFARVLQGLTQTELDNAIATSITHLRYIHIDKLLNEKKQVLRKSDILEFINVPVKLEDVGGLDLAKAYLSKYGLAQEDKAKEYGVEPLKGVILSGVPGTGKSLFAKAIGKMWKLPLLRLDVGKVMSSLVGQSEGKMRTVISQIEAMAPCVLWIDEVEKSLSGTKSSNFSDGGTLSRVFGTLLHAMQDRMDGVTIIATANDITRLPPEFIRRFNEVFFVDLPGPEERWDIFSIHLTKRGRNPAKFTKYKQKLIDASVNYTGAEIEKAIQDAIASAFYNNSKDVTVKDIVSALEDTKPISRIMKKQIDNIRETARGQYRFASSWADQQSQVRNVSTKKGKKLNVDSALDDLSEIKRPLDKAKMKNKTFDNKDRFTNLG
jgi:ATP-dependent 26S proteasome regulatory subunit